MPKQLNDLSNLASGDYAVINSSRIYSDALLPALYLGVDPKDNTKHIFVIAPNPEKVINIEERLQVVTSKTLRILQIKWESKHREVNSTLYRLHSEISKIDSSVIINLDSIILEEA